MEESDSEIRVLSLNTSDTGGGAAHAAYRIHNGVRSLGIDSQMFVKFKASDDSSVRALSDFIPKNFVYRFCDWCVGKIKNKIQRARWHKYPLQDNLFKSDLRGTRICGALHKIPFDILHLHWINQRFLNITDLRKVRKPIVWTLHDSWPFCGVCHYFLDCKKYQRQCGRCPQLGSRSECDLSREVWSEKAKVYRDLDLHVVTPSRWLADCARKSSLFGDVDIRVIPNCLDTRLFHPMETDEIRSLADHAPNESCAEVLKSASLPHHDATPQILFGAVNALTDKIKGFDYLVSALSELDAKGLRARLIVYGVEEAPSALSFTNISVAFVGFIRNASVMAALCSVSDLTVVPSISENLSYAIMESLSCGTPVVAFNIGGNSDLIEHERNGYLATEKDSSDFARGIEWCLRNDSDGHLSRQAHIKACRDYSIEVVARQYADLYRQINKASK